MLQSLPPASEAPSTDRAAQASGQGSALAGIDEAGSLAKRNSSADSLRAYDYLNQALRLDPRFALAWAALAELYTNDSVEWGKIFPPDDGTGQNLDLSATKFALGSNRVSVAAHDAGARALALDPNEADIHRSMARVIWWFDFNWDAADAELRKARALDPGSARIFEQSAQLAITMGRITEGLALANNTRSSRDGVLGYRRGLPSARGVRPGCGSLPAPDRNSPNEGRGPLSLRIGSSLPARAAGCAGTI